MGKRKRINAVMVTNSPLISPEVLLCDDFGRKPAERVELRQMNRRQRLRNEVVELEQTQAEKRQRLMKAAIIRPERNNTVIEKVFLDKGVIAKREAEINGNVKLVADKSGVHFSNKRIEKKDLKKAVDANLHGTESRKFVFRDSVSGKVVGETAIRTNKIW